MEYSSSKKGRLPGISFDFDNSDNSDDSDNSCSSLQENNNTNTVEQNRANIIEEMKSMGFQGATTILSSSTISSNTIIPQQHSQPTEVASDDNNNSQTTPSKQSLTNPPSSSNKQPRSTSKPRGNKSTKVSPTTSKLHTTANNLVINTPNTTLDKVDNTAVAMVIESVNSVKKNLRLSLSPWRNKDDRLISLIAASDKMSEKEGRSSRSEDSISSISSGGGENKEKGEQTAILDAAADYLYRMENQYNLSNPDTNNKEGLVAAEDSNNKELIVENGNEELLVEVNNNSSSGGDEGEKNEGLASNTAADEDHGDDSSVEGIQRRTSRRIQDKQIKEVEEKQAEINNATLAARELRDKLLAAEVDTTEVDNNQQTFEQKVPNNNNKPPVNNKKGKKKKGRGKSTALSQALGAAEDLNTPYKKECIYNLVDNDEDEVEGNGDEVNGTAADKVADEEVVGDKDEADNADGEEIKEGKVVSSPLARKEEEGGITNTEVVDKVEDDEGAMSNTEEEAPTEDYNYPIPSSNNNDTGAASYTSGTPDFLNQEETTNNSPSNADNSNQLNSSYIGSSQQHSSNNNSSNNNINEPTDDMTQYLQDESFYIGKDDGFLSSQSVDSSDISETASEADSADDIVSCGDTVVQEDGDINNEEGWDEEWGDSNLEDDDNLEMAEQSINDGIINLSTLIKESAKMIADEDPNHYTENREVYKELILQTNSSSNRCGGGFDSSANSLSPSIDNVVQLLNTSTNDELNQSSVGEEEEAVESSVKEEAAVTTPTSSINQEVPNSTTSQQQQHDFVPTALKNIVSKQEDELSNLLSSIDNIQSTPGRIAQMLQNEEDTDEGLVGIVDMSSVPSAGGRGISGVMRSGGLSPVKKRLIMDNGGTPMEKKLEPLVEEEVVKEEVESPSVVKEEVKHSSPDVKVESRVPATPASLPQSPSANTTLPPPTSVNVSAITTDLNQSLATAEATPQGPPEPVASPPVRSPWLSFLSNNSPTDNNNSQTQSPEQVEEEGASSPQQRELDEDAAAEPNTSISNQAVEDSAVSKEDDSSDDDEYQQSNVEYTTALAIPLEGGDIAQESNATTEEEEEDFIPESMKLLFQDADSTLQNAMPTLSPVRPAKGGQGANGKEGTVFTELSLEMEEDAARRLAMEMINTEQAKLDRLENERRLEREKLAAEEEVARQAECDRLEKERLEQERLAAEEEEARRFEAAEKVAAHQEAERQAKLAEDARLKAEEDDRIERERLAETERLEKIRIEQQLAEEARLEAERLAEVERQQALLAEQQRQKKEEDARLLVEEAKRVTEQAELDRLEQERLESERLEKERLEEEARKAEIERLEKERIEQERILAEQQAVEEARLKAEEQERLAAEEAALFQSRLEEGIEQKILANQRATEELERSRDTLIADAAAKFEAQRLEEAARKAASMNHDDNNGHPTTSTSVSSNDNNDNNTSISSNNNVSITATNDDTFDTAMCSFSGIEKALDNEFFDANDKADALGTTMDDEQVSDNEEKKMNEEEDKDSSTDIDILDRVGRYMNKVAEMDVSVEKSSEDCPTSDEPEDEPTTMDGDNSRPSSLDESVLNESMFMPNAAASSPEPNEILPLDMEPMLPMSEDDSDSSEEETDDIEAFLPPSMVESVLKKPNQCKPVVSKPSSTSSHPISNVISRTKRSLSDRSPLPTNEEKKGRKISSATLKRQERANQSPSSNVNRKKAATPPPSNVKPAKKRSKSMVIVKDSTTTTKPIVKVSSATLKRQERANNRPLQSPPTAAKPAKKRSKSIVQANKSSSLRIMRSEASNSTVVTRGKENNKGDSMTRRSSMKQSLVSMTKSRRQDDSNVQVSNQEKKPKKKVDMDRISRLAKPQRRSMAKPSATSASSTTTNKSIKKRVNGPPSLLTRIAPSRSYVKSTVELEQEEMERVKPFKAKKIHGSIDVPSRYKTAAKRVPRPSTSVESSSSKPKSFSASRPPGYSPRRQSGLYKPTPSRKKVSTFGESVNHYLHHGLRGPSSKLPTPKPPSEAFLRRQTMSNSQHVKSTEEIELEECQKQFKAKEYGYGSVPMSSRRTTMSSYTPVASSEQLELEECQKQFKARPLPGAGGRRVHRSRRAAPQQQGRTLTVPSPFRLHSNVPKPPPPSTDDVELSKPFRARPLPNSSSRFYKDGSNDTPYHVRAQEQYALSRARKERFAEDDEHQGTFRANPVPKTTYQPQEIERIDNTANLTQPKTPTLSLKCRAEERKVFDQYAEEVREAEQQEKEMLEQQQRDMEEEEIRRLRTSSADEGGTCFIARQISIEYA